MSAIAEPRSTTAALPAAAAAARPAISPRAALTRWRRAHPVYAQVVARTAFLVALFGGAVAGTFSHMLLFGLAVGVAFGAIGSYLSLRLAITHARRLRLRVADELPARQVTLFAIATVLALAAPLAQPYIG